MNLPIRRANFDVQGFLAFVAKNGGEVCTPTNPYEVVRYRAYWKQSKRPETQIVYAKENGLLTWTKGTQWHYQAFLEGRGMGGQNAPHKPTFTGSKTITAGSTKGEKTRAKLRKRDGDECWFCGKPMGDDCTIEHLIAKADGGRNSLSNYALAHQACNQKAANKPLVEKLALRADLRGEMA